MQQCKYHTKLQRMNHISKIQGKIKLDAMLGNHNLKLVRWSQFSIFGTSSSHLPHQPSIGPFGDSPGKNSVWGIFSEIISPKDERMSPQKGTISNGKFVFQPFDFQDRYVSFSGE